MRSATVGCSCSCHRVQSSGGTSGTARPIVMPAYLHEALAAEYAPPAWGRPAWEAPAGCNGGRSSGGAQLRLWKRGDRKSGDAQNRVERSVLRAINGPERRFWRSVLPEQFLVAPAEASLDHEPEGDISGMVRIEDLHTVGQSMIRPGVRVMIEEHVQESDALRGDRPDPVLRQFVGIVHASNSEGICFRTREGHMNHWCTLHRIGASAWVHFMGREAPVGNWSDDDFAAHLERSFVPEGLVGFGCWGA